MHFVRKVKTFFSFEKETILLLIEALYFLGWARLKKFNHFTKLAQSLGNQSIETVWETGNSSNRITVKKISNAVHIMSRYTVWESQCFVKAMAAMQMLKRRGIESTIYFGTAKDEDGKLIAHAWLRSGSFYLTGAEVMERFTVVSKFAWNTPLKGGGSND